MPTCDSSYKGKGCVCYNGKTKFTIVKSDEKFIVRNQNNNIMNKLVI